MIDYKEFSNKIRIKKSATADSRSCDFRRVDKETLLKSTNQHKKDVLKAMEYFCKKIKNAGKEHDNHKLFTMDEFHQSFITGMKDKTWWDEHKQERHHLPDDMEDINLIDVMEFICDCVMSGMARTGEVRPLEIDKDKLYKAFQNTAQLLIDSVDVVE